MKRFATALMLSGVVGLTGPALLGQPVVVKVDPVQRNVANLEGHLQGTIVAVDSDTIVVRPMSGDGEKKVKIVNHTTIQVNGRMATPDDLREGHLVDVMTETVGGQLVASYVNATSQM